MHNNSTTSKIHSKKTITTVIFAIFFSCALFAQPQIDISTFQHDNARIRELVIAGNNKTLVARSGDNVLVNNKGVIVSPTVHVWDIETKKEIASFSDKELGRAACFSKDGLYLAYREKNTINVMDIATKKVVSIIKVDENKFARPFSFIRDNKGLIVERGTMSMIYDVTTDFARLEKEIKTDGLNHFVSRDDSYLVETFIDSFKLIDLKTGEKINTFLIAEPKHEDLKSLLISNDSRFIVTLSDGKVKMWDTKTAKNIISFNISARDNIHAFSPDGRYIIGGNDTLKLWELRSKKEITTPVICENLIAKVAISPDSRTIIVGDVKGVMKMWSFTDDVLAEIYFAKEIESETRLISQKREFEKTDEFQKRKLKVSRSIRTKYLNQYIEKTTSEKTLQDQWVEDDDRREEERKTQLRNSRVTLNFRVDSIGPYNADKETFTIRLANDDEKFNHWETIKVPLRDNAQCFKQRIQNATVTGMKQLSENLKSFEYFNIKIRSNCTGKDKDYVFGTQRTITDE